jgi:hypothetical protein
MGIRAIGILLLSSAVCLAEVVFEATTIDLKAEAGQNVIQGEFQFKVIGNGVGIQKVDAPCSCLAVTISDGSLTAEAKREWKPGETGKVSAKFSIGNLRGVVEKEIFLTIKGQEKKIRLVCKLHVPELFKIEPTSHVWPTGAKLTEKVFKVKVNHDKPIRIVEHSGQDDNFPYKVVTIRDGWEYEIRVKPKSTSAPRMGRISLLTDCSIKRHKRHQVYTLVKAKKKQVKAE